jgi:hypothetical protein
MLDPAVDATGVAGMRTVAGRVASWSDEKLVRFAATGEFIIERGGNGGGFFRRMYASFLHQFADGIAPAGVELADAFETIAARWTALANLLGETARAPSPSARAPEIAQAFQALADLEERAWSRAWDAAS